MGSSPIGRTILLVLIVGCAGLSGCGKDSATSDAKSPDPTTTANSTTTSLAATTDAPVTTTPSTAAATSTAPPTTDAPASSTPSTAALEPTVAPRAGDEYLVTPEYGSPYAAFKSPSGRINCSINNDAADCVLVDNTWEVPPPDEPCDATWGMSVEVAGTRARLTCRGDAPPVGPALPYGHEIAHGPFLCRSDESGITCDNQETGHGFKINRASFDLY